MNAQQVPQEHFSLEYDGVLRCGICYRPDDGEEAIWPCEIFQLAADLAHARERITEVEKERDEARVENQNLRLEHLIWQAFAAERRKRRRELIREIEQLKAKAAALASGAARVPAEGEK